MVGALLAAWLLTSCSTAEEPQSVTPPSSQASQPDTGEAQGSASRARRDRGAPAPALASPAPIPAAARPERIVIPSIGVDSSLVDLGLQKDGTLEVPADYQQAGWFDRSAAPGRQGPAVIAGHVDSRTGPAVFYRLGELKAGADIRITTAGGKTLSFTVDDVQQYRKTKFPTAAVYGPVPGPVLRLITCGGQFDAQEGHYRDNLVVYAS